MSGGRSDGPAAVNDTGHVTNNAKRSRRVAPKDGGPPARVSRCGLAAWGLLFFKPSFGCFEPVLVCGKGIGGEGAIPKAGLAPGAAATSRRSAVSVTSPRGSQAPETSAATWAGRRVAERGDVWVACGANGRHVVKGLSGSRAFPAHEQMRV